MAKRKGTTTETIVFKPTEYNYKGTIIKIVIHEIQETSKGVKFVYKRISKNMHVNSIWVNGVEKWHWIYRFEYLNFSKSGFMIEVDHHDNICKFTEIKHSDNSCKLTYN